MTKIRCFFAKDVDHELIHSRQSSIESNCGIDMSHHTRTDWRTAIYYEQYYKQRRYVDLTPRFHDMTDIKSLEFPYLEKKDLDMVCNMKSIEIDMDLDN